MWSHTHEDLKVVTSLHVQREMARALSATEGLIYVAGQIFGGGKDGGKGSSGKATQIETADDAMAFARMING